MPNKCRIKIQQIMKTDKDAADVYAAYGRLASLHGTGRILVKNDRYLEDVEYETDGNEVRAKGVIDWVFTAKDLTDFCSLFQDRECATIVTYIEPEGHVCGMYEYDNHIINCYYLAGSEWPTEEDYLGTSDPELLILPEGENWEDWRARKFEEYFDRLRDEGSLLTWTASESEVYASWQEYMRVERETFEKLVMAQSRGWEYRGSDPEDPYSFAAVTSPAEL